MKTLEELKIDRLKKEKHILKELHKSYVRNDISNITKYEIGKKKIIINSAIDNLTDLVRQEIAKNANLLFDGIKEVLKKNEFARLYYGDFEEFVEAVASLKKTACGYERISNNPINIDIQNTILYFGFTEAELEALLKTELFVISRDKFMLFFNKKYKTLIPIGKDFERYMLDGKKKDIDANEKNKYEYRLLQLHNGDFIHDGYTYCYEYQLEEHYKVMRKTFRKLLK